MRTIHYFIAMISLAITTTVAAQSFVTFESSQVRPLALSPDGQRLFAVNTPDNRLEIFNVLEDGLVLESSVPVGLEPVAVALRSNDEVWVVNHLSDSVSIVDVSGEPRVTNTLLVGDEPNDIVFGGPGGNRAFITTAHRGQNSPYPQGEYGVAGQNRADVWVFDASAPHINLGGSPLTIVTLFGDKPRALAVSDDGSRVFAAVFHSGNKSTTISEGLVCDAAGPCAIQGGTAPGSLPPPTANFEASAGPQTGLIVQFDPVSGEWRDELDRDWSDAVRFSLPDLDVFEIDANAAMPVEVANYSGVGTILFNMIYDSSRDALWVSNTDANNRVRFEGEGVVAGAVKPAGEDASVRGKLALSQVTVVDLNNDAVMPRHLNKHIPYGTHPVPAGIKDASLATPQGMVLSQDGATLYVAGFGSQAIGVYDATALMADSFNPQTATQITLGGGGPTGMVIDQANNRLYVATRFDNSIGVVDLATQTETARYTLHNPEPQSVIDGRPFLYDAKLTSSNGEASCSSCHISGDMDDIAWDLGDPDGSVVSNDNPFTVGSGAIFHPMKGPMTTQSLRGMADQGPMHWRGDRTGTATGGSAFDEDLAFKAFNGAFVGLIGRDEGELDPTQMQAFTDFVLQITYPPNPIRNLDNSLRVDEQRGFDAYFQTPGPDIVQSCNGCHVLDRNAGFFGTDGNSSIEGEPQEFKIPHLRNMYQKVGMFGMPDVPFFNGGDNAHKGDQIRGFGFLHDGSTDTTFRFFNATVFNAGFNAFFPNPGQTRLDLEAFMMAFDSNLYPVVGQQVTLHVDNYASDVNVDTDAEERINLLIGQASLGHADVTAVVHEVNGSFGAKYNGVGFDLDSILSPAMTLQQIKEHAATQGQFVTFTAVPFESGQRIALDRDQDTTLNSDDNCPAVANEFQEDADGDGIGDACDVCTLIDNPDQIDSNGDGYGNRCDPDLDNDGIVNFLDVGLFASLIFTSDPHADINGDGAVNFLDFTIFPEFIFAAPGPSALAP